MAETLKEKTIALGIGGGIAAYKCCELVRLLVKEGAEVHVILTKAAQEFVTPLTLQTLSKNPVFHEEADTSRGSGYLVNFHEVSASSCASREIPHIALADQANLIVIAPATADLIAKAAHGLANDLLTNVLLATRAPILFCPSMNVNMWNHRATQANVGRLKELGYQVLEPAEGELACGWEGAGRLVEPAKILARMQELLR